jgi:tetratricopeptide (TPR) repeat protein
MTNRNTQLALLAPVLLLSACAGIDEYAREFDARWKGEGTAAVTVSEAFPKADPALIERHKRRLAGLTPGSSCSAIYEIAPSILGSDASDPDAGLKLAACDFETRDYASARTRFRQIRDFEKDPRALKGLAMTELKDGKIEAALPLLKQVNTMTGQSDWQIMNALGYAEDQLEHFAEAEAAYVAAASLAPSRGAPMNNLGMMYLRKERYQDAIKAFTIALNREPGLDIAEFNRRIAYGVSGNIQKALAGATERERSAVLNSMGAAALGTGDRAKARTLFRDALESSPIFYQNAWENLETAELAPERK